MLNLIGLGISPINSISLNGIEALKKSDFVFIELYTCNVNFDLAKLEKVIHKKIIPLNRERIETENNILIKNALKKNVCLLVGGDPLSATTHKELLIDAKNNNINFKIMHSSSIITAVGQTGLELYKFGRIVSLPFFKKNYTPLSPYNYIEENLKNNLHTLVLLDINMTPNTAFNQMLLLEAKIKHNIFNLKTKLIMCKDLGCENQVIKFNSIENLQKHNYENALYCLLVPSNKLNFKEKEFLDIVVGK